MIATVGLLLLAGCPAPPPAAGPAAGGANSGLSSRTPLERLFPLRDQYIYQYDTSSDEGAGASMLVHVRRDAEMAGALQLPGGVKRFAYGSDGVRLVKAGAAPSYVLKQPLRRGASWRGEHGGRVEVTEIDAAVQVPAGRFAHCVRTVERRGGDQPLQVATTFCPDVGIVLLEAASGAELERAVLRSYGPPVEIGPHGLREAP